MEKAELNKLLQRKSRAKKYSKDQVVFREGDPPADGLVLVLAGAVRIEKNIGGTRITVGRVNHGEMFGEAALLLKTPRTADAFAEADDTILLFFDKRAFLEEARDNPRLIHSMLLLTIGRIERGVEKLLDLRVPVRLYLTPELGGVIHESRKKNLQVPSLFHNTKPPLFRQGYEFFKQGEFNTGELFLVVEGTVMARWTDGHTTSDIFAFEAGDYFGYSRRSVMPFRAYTAVAASEQTRVVHFSFETMEKVLSLDIDCFFSYIASILAVLLALNEGVTAVQTGNAFRGEGPETGTGRAGGTAGNGGPAVHDRSIKGPVREVLSKEKMGAGVHKPAKN